MKQIGGPYQFKVWNVNKIYARTWSKCNGREIFEDKIIDHPNNFWADFKTLNILRNSSNTGESVVGQAQTNKISFILLPYKIDVNQMSATHAV